MPANRENSFRVPQVDFYLTVSVYRLCVLLDLIDEEKDNRNFNPHSLPIVEAVQDYVNANQAEINSCKLPTSFMIGIDLKTNNFKRKSITDIPLLIGILARTNGSIYIPSAKPVYDQTHFMRDAICFLESEVVS